MNFTFPAIRLATRAVVVTAPSKRAVPIFADENRDCPPPRGSGRSAIARRRSQAGVKLAERFVADCRSIARRFWRLTSPGDGDGKTTLAEILAPELAKRTAGGTLAVDANFRKADLTARLAIPATAAPLGSSLIYPTDLAGLNVLPMSHRRECRGADAGLDRGDARELAAVMLDMASLEHAETAPILRHCDGVCLVVRIGHTARRAVAEAARVIAVCGGRLLGCVLVGEAA